MIATTTELYKISKILKGLDVPYWLKDKKGNDVLFKYYDGYKEFLQQLFNELWEQWRREHPYDVLNGKKETKKYD